jgi:hypothetical protein
MLWGLFLEIGSMVTKTANYFLYFITVYHKGNYKLMNYGDFSLGFSLGFS